MMVALQLAIASSGLNNMYTSIYIDRIMHQKEYRHRMSQQNWRTIYIVIIRGYSYIV